MKDEGKSIIIKTTQDTMVQFDDVINLSIRPEKIHLFDKESEVTLIQDIPEYNFVDAEVKGNELALLDGKIALPQAILDQVSGQKALSLEVPPHAIVKGNSLKLKVAKVEKLGEQHLAHLAYKDHFIFALVEKGVKEGDSYGFDILLDKVKIIGENLQVEPLKEKENLSGKFVKKDISRTEVEFYYVINEERIHDSVGNGFKINSVDGNDCYKKTYRYVFERSKAVVGDTGIQAIADKVLDYGYIRYVVAKVGEEEIMLILPEGMEANPGDEIHFALNGEDVEVWEPKNDFRIC